jgi:hypothetical protein
LFLWSGLYAIIEERLLVEPIDLSLIILRIKFILEVDLMLILVVLLDASFTDDLLDCIDLLIKRDALDFVDLLELLGLLLILRQF